MTSRPDDRVPLRWPWPWIATLVGIALFFGLLIGVALHVQRSAERELAEHQRELGAIEHRRLEIELETERILQASAAARPRPPDGEATEPAGTRLSLTLLSGASSSHAQACGAVAWHAALASGQLRLAALPPQPQPHTYELWRGEQPIAGSRFSAPAGGDVQVTLPMAAAQGLAGPGPLTVRLSQGRPPDDLAPAVIVLQEP